VFSTSQILLEVPTTTCELGQILRLMFNNLKVLVICLVETCEWYVVAGASRTQRRQRNDAVKETHRSTSMKHNGDSQKGS